MYTRVLIFRLAMFLAVPGLQGVAAGLAYDVGLQTPKLQSLQTSLSPTGGAVAVQIQIQYSLKGTVSCTGQVNGASAVCLGTVKTGTGGTTYKFTVRSATVPPTVISIAGSLGTGTASCSYSGPNGRTNAPAIPVTIQAVQPVPASVRLSPVINDKNLISGAGWIDAGYTTNPPLAGTVKGKVASNSVSLLVKQDKRSAIFNGKRVGNAYVGPLRLTIPPAKQTITNFSLPVMDVPLASGQAVFRGVLTVISNQMPAPAAGTTITLRSDVNGDGKFLGREVLRAVANAQGRYELKATVVRHRPVLLEIRRAGFAEILQCYPSVTPGAILARNATLQSLDTLEVVDGAAVSSDGAIFLDGLPEQVESVQARVFDPATDSSQFPGQYADNLGNLLVSSVFSSIEATDGSGRSVTNLGTNATLSMKVPKNSWPTLGDLMPGNNQIDVPLYCYDEDAGQWKRNSADGWLENATRTRIPEDQLASILAGTFPEEIFAVGPVAHLSWWNIDWPISTHSSIGGIIVDTNGTPVQGASISVFGLSYSGTSGPNTTAEDGAFCLDIMRSENIGEDLDRDGVTGETQQVQLRVQVGGNQYSFVPFSSPQMPGTCEGGGGLDVGVLTLSQSNLLTVSLCTVTGRVVYSGVSIGGTPSALQPGDGIHFATVTAFDPDAFDAASICTNCLVTTADSFGNFSLQVPVLSGVTLAAYASHHSYINGFGFFAGSVTTAGCPGSGVTFPLDYVHWGAYTVLLENNRGELLGNATINIEGNIVVILYPNYPDFSTYYIGSRPNINPPFRTGIWAIVGLRNNSPGTGVGTIYFDATRIYPARGTWRIQGGSVNLSGTWESGF